MDKDRFPAECRGCYANCYACTKEKNGHRLPEIRQLAAGRKLKVQAIAFGDFSYYNIGDRGSRSLGELRELFAGNGMVGFLAKERVDGKLVLPEAVQCLQMKA